MSEYSILVDNFDVCRICLTDRGADGYESFVDVMMTPIDGKQSKKLVLDYLGVDIDESDDVKPKMICKCCFEALDNFHKLKKKANECQIFVEYIARKIVGGTVPETSVASTSSLMLSSNEESSNSMPGTSKASTPSIMFRKNKVSSQEPPPFKHSRLPSKKSYKFGDSMPGTSKASISSLILRNNEESSHSMPGTSKASTSSMMLRNNEESSHSMPGTSKAYTSSMMLRNNEISSQEQTFKRSRLPSKNIKYKFGDSMPGTSKSSQSIIRRSNKNGTNLNPNINNVLNDLSVPSVSSYLSTKDIKSESDDDCIITSETVVISDEDDDDDKIENVDLSDDDSVRTYLDKFNLI